MLSRSQFHHVHSKMAVSSLISKQAGMGCQMAWLTLATWKYSI
jgi:hypothetical protein